ncbi:hypothetical protein SLA2020_075600 [Shorea laevis]
MDEDAENQPTPIEIEANSKSNPGDQNSIGPWMVVDRRKNKKKNFNGSSQNSQGTQNCANSVSEVKDNRTEKMQVGPELNGTLENAFNEDTVTNNGTLKQMQKEAMEDGNGQAQGYGQVRKKSISWAQSNLKNSTMQVNQIQRKDKEICKDKISLHKKDTRLKGGSKGLTIVQKDSQDVNNLQHEISPSTRNVGHESDIAKDSESCLGCTVGQGRQLSATNAESVISATRKGLQSSRGMGPTNNSNEVDQPYCASKRGGSYSFSSSTIGLGTANPKSSITRQVHHVQSNMELGDGDCGMEPPGGTDLPPNHNHTVLQRVPEQDINERTHEGCSSHSQEGGSTMLYRGPLHTNSSTILLPGSEYADPQQTNGHCSVESKTGHMGAEFLQ